MAEDWSLDVRKYVPDADQGVIDAIVRYLGIALQKRDSSLVSFTDKTETDRVRENFLKKKLGLTLADSELDAGIAAIGERMKGDRTKNRVTVYYLLAEAFRKLSVFGGHDAAVAGLGAAGLGAAGLGAAGLAAGAAAATPKVETLAERRPAPDPEPVAAFSARPAAAAAAPKAASMRWLLWLLLAALLAALLWWLFAGRHGAKPTVETTAPPAATAPAVPDATAPPAPATTDVAAATTALFPAKVFFANDSAAIPADGGQLIERAAAALKTEGGKVAVTAYTDRTGDLAHNQELAKNRAVAVRDALMKAGIAEADIEMRPPATVEIGTAGVMDADARRVEITRP